MAHSWVQMYNDELQAFKDYCELYPHNATLLVDTYNVLQSGIPNAIRAFRKYFCPGVLPSVPFASIRGI
jgi:nicotinate phosphoribosyltransferase